MKKIKERDRKLLEKRRLSAGTLFKKGVSQAVVAKKYDVSRGAVCQWHTEWKKKGRNGLKSKGAPGFASKLTEKKKKRLKLIILKGPVKSGYQTDFWTVNRIREVARKNLRINLGYTRIWNTVLSLGFTCQKPERRALERDEKAITDWKLKTFPRLKKMGGKAPLSHRFSR